jgi:hypothetical protein
MPNNTGGASTFFRVRYIDRGDEERFVGPYAQLGWARRAVEDLQIPVSYRARPKEIKIQKLTGEWEDVEEIE